MRIQAINDGIILSHVFSGVGIQTDLGLFGIAQRDGGIEVMLNGKTVWTSHELAESARTPEPKGVIASDTAPSRPVAGDSRSLFAKWSGKSIEFVVAYQPHVAAGSKAFPGNAVFGTGRAIWAEQALRVTHAVWEAPPGTAGEEFTVGVDGPPVLNLGGSIPLELWRDGVTLQEAINKLEHAIKSVADWANRYDPWRPHRKLSNEKEPTPDSSAFHEITSVALCRIRNAILHRIETLDPVMRNAAAWLDETLEAINAARRALHGAWTNDNPTAPIDSSPYFSRQ